MNSISEKVAHDWMLKNLVDKNEGAEITKQSIKGFNQSVYLGHIKPFFEIDGKGPSNIKLYLKSDLEEYAKNKRS